MQGTERWAGHRVAECAEPAGGRGLRRCPVSAQRGDEEQVEEPVKDRLLAGLSAADFLGQQCEQRAQRRLPALATTVTAGSAASIAGHSPPSKA